MNSPHPVKSHPNIRYPVTLERVPYFSGNRMAAASTARAMGIPQKDFRFIEPDSHKLYGTDKGMVVLFWCENPIALIKHHQKFYQHLKSLDASVVFIA